MKLNEKISNEEKIIWSGKKNTRVSIFETIINNYFFTALIWGGFDFLILFESMDSIANSDLATAIVIPIFFSIHLIPVWIYLFGAIASLLNTKHTEYVVTDKAVYIQSGTFNIKVQRKPYKKMSKVTIKRGFFDKRCCAGDIICKCGDFEVLDGGKKKKEMHIENITEYEMVCMMIKKRVEECKVEMESEEEKYIEPMESFSGVYNAYNNE